ncbi:nucleoside hydrolase [Pseudomonas duriflava]|nr:nucleoside hydrolase [Pseudomonas duriflava]
MTTTPIIFDTDPGIDDAQAIALIMADPGIEVVGLTTTFGNVSIETATRNALLLVELAGLDIPVAQGVGTPLEKTPYPVPTHVHGDDGLGNLHLPAPTRQAVSQSAAEFIVEQTRQRPGEITLVAVGPLGNLAKALELDPEVVHRVARVVVMGGSIREGGNVTPLAEANIFSDPHAAAQVLTAGWPLTLVGLDVTHRTCLDPARMQRITEAHRTLGPLLAHSYAFYAKFYGSALGIDGCCPHDSCAVAWLRRPDLFQTVRGHLNVITEGLAEGQTIFAPEGRQYVDEHWSRSPVVDVCLGIDGAAVVDWMESVLTTHG